MTKDTLRQIINHWMSAESLLRRIKVHSGPDMGGLEPALDQALESILQLQEPDDTSLTIKGHRIRSALTELEVAKLMDDSARVVHWSAILVQATSDLVADYLGEEAMSLADLSPENTQ